MVRMEHIIRLCPCWLRIFRLCTRLLEHTISKLVPTVPLRSQNKLPVILCHRCLRDSTSPCGNRSIFRRRPGMWCPFRLRSHSGSQGEQRCWDLRRVVSGFYINNVGDRLCFQATGTWKGAPFPPAHAPGSNSKSDGLAIRPKQEPGEAWILTLNRRRCTISVRGPDNEDILLCETGPLDVTLFPSVISYVPSSCTVQLLEN